MVKIIIYIEGSMNIFILHIAIIGPLFHFDCNNFKASLVIKIMNFNDNLKMAHLAKLVIFHVNVNTCQIFYFLAYVYRIFVKKAHFLI